MTCHITRYLAVFVTALNVAGGAQAQQSAIYNGGLDYQELSLSANTYYVAVFSDRLLSATLINAAWAARAAQLCAASGSDAFVPLRYVDEPVIVEDVDISLFDHQAARTHRVAAGTIFVPIFIPSGPREVHLEMPGKAGAVRCLPAGADLRNPARLVRASVALDAAQRAGVPR